MKVTTKTIPTTAHVAFAPVFDEAGREYRFVRSPRSPAAGVRPWVAARIGAEVPLQVQVAPVDGGCVVSFDIPDGATEPAPWDIIQLELSEVGATNASGGDSDLARFVRLATHAVWLVGRSAGEVVAFPLASVPPPPGEGSLVELLEWLETQSSSGTALVLDEDWVSCKGGRSCRAVPWATEGWSKHLAPVLGEHIQRVRSWRPRVGSPSRHHEARLGADVVARLWGCLTLEQISASINKSAGLYGAVWDNVGPLTPSMVQRTIEGNFPFTCGSAQDVVDQACAAWAGITCPNGANESHPLVKEWRKIQREKLDSLGLAGWPLECLDAMDVRVVVAYDNPGARSLGWLEYWGGAGTVPIPTGETPDSLLRAEILRVYPEGHRV